MAVRPGHLDSYCVELIGLLSTIGRGARIGRGQLRQATQAPGAWPVWAVTVMAIVGTR